MLEGWVAVGQGPDARGRAHEILGVRPDIFPQWCAALGAVYLDTFAVEPPF
jgi:hypothetical protein